ncbi:MAG: hypothetical protein K6E29_01560 [Cyanobacteria bacterium RUI128]|nr:hypothetical protein [Cyanobacteria bacterium RUI128]
MGMSSSQARLLNLTARMHQIEYKAAKLEAQKLQMANESRRVYDNYLQALDARKVQFATLTAKGSVDYADATLAGLENSIVHATEILTSTKAYLLQNVRTNQVYLTQKVADQLGITETEATELPDKKTYLNDRGVYEVDEMETVPNYTDIKSVTPVGNTVIEPGTTEYTKYSYSVQSGSIAAPHDITDQNYSVTYTPSGSVSAPDSIIESYQTQCINAVTPVTEGVPDSQQIRTAEEFVSKLHMNSGTFYLMNDIDLSDYIHSHGFWAEIHLLESTLNGNGHQITGLSGNKALFTFISDSTIENLCVIDANLSTNNDEMGILAEEMNSSTIDNCYVSGTVSTGYCVGGGIVGYLSRTNAGNNFIINSSADVNLVNNAYPHDGGILGNCNATGSSSLIIDNCYTNSPRVVSDQHGTEVISDTSTNVDFSDITTHCVKGTIDGMAGPLDIKAYYAYKMYSSPSNTSGKTYDQYLSQLSSALSHNDYAYASLSSHIGTSEESAVVTRLINGDYSDTTTYTSDEYDIINVKPNGSYNVTKSETQECHEVTVAATEDIINALAVGVHTNLGTAAEKEQLSTYADRIRNNFTEAELASLTQYANNNTKLALIINALSQGNGACLKSNVSALSLSGISITTYNGFTISHDASNVVIKETTGTGYETNPTGTVEIPQTSEIASNLVVAFRKAGKTIDNESAVANNLANKSLDNEYLADLNHYVANYLNGGNSSSINAIYNYIMGSGTKPSISASYDHSAYSAVQVNKGNCVVEYGTRQQATGNKVWDTTDPNYIRYSAEYDNAVKLREAEVTYKIIDDDLANSTEYLNTLLDNDSFVLIDFSKGLGEDMTHTNISVETNLQEVSDETLLRKAEAQYEADMRKIDRKDRMYDHELAALDNERNAIKSEMETLKTVAKDNVERTFKLFG